MRETTGGEYGRSRNRWLGWICCIICIFAQRATAQEPLSAGIVIEANAVQGALSPLLYGQFLEFMFEGIKGGMQAELIRNRSFEEAANSLGLSRDWERYPDDRNDDYGLALAWDNQEFYPPRPRRETPGRPHSMRIDARAGVLLRHGIYQSRVPVRAGIEYRGYLWLKTKQFEGRLVVALEQDVTDGELYAEAGLGMGAGDAPWKRYPFLLKPGKSDPLARFAVLVDGRGQVWVDQVSLMPADAVDEVRADVFAKVRALRPAFIRWPGGNVAQDYHWQWGIGPRDERPTWINLSWKNEPEPSDFGTDEFIRVCRRLGAEPSITVNVEGRGATAAEAAAWVEYCNGPASSNYGAMRAAGGHPEPYAVKYWEVGNEIWGNWVRGHSDATRYAENFNRYAAAMHSVDPTIRLIGVGDNDLTWNRTVLRRAGKRMDYLAIHHYYTAKETQGDPRNLMARPLYYQNFYDTMRGLLREAAPGRSIKLAINEWGLDIPEPRQHSMEAALYGARLLNVFERTADLVHMSAVSDLVNGWPGGIIQASRHALFVTPTYLVNQLYAQHHGAELLSSKVQSPTFDSSLEGKDVPYLDATASRSQDRAQIFIKMVNTHPTRSLRTKVSVTGAEIGAQAVLESITGRSPDSANSFRVPEAISIGRTEVAAASEFVIDLPERSVSVLTLKAR